MATRGMLCTSPGSPAGPGARWGRPVLGSQVTESQEWMGLDGGSASSAILGKFKFLKKYWSLQTRLPNRKLASHDLKNLHQWFLLKSFNIRDCIPIPKLFKVHFAPQAIRSFKTVILVSRKQWLEQTIENLSHTPLYQAFTLQVAISSCLWSI